METIISLGKKSKCPFIISKSRNELIKLSIQPAKRTFASAAGSATAGSATGQYKTSSGQSDSLVNVLIYSGSTGTGSGGSGASGGGSGGSVTSASASGVKSLQSIQTRYNALVRLADYKCPFVSISTSTSTSSRMTTSRHNDRSHCFQAYRNVNGGSSISTTRQNVRSISTTPPPRAQLILNDLEVLKKKHAAEFASVASDATDGTGMPTRHLSPTNLN